MRRMVASARTDDNTLPRLREGELLPLRSAQGRSVAVVRVGLLAAALAVGLALAGESRADTIARGLRPGSVFMQAGTAGDTDALVFGAAWPWAWQRRFRGGELTGYWEASFGRWSTTRDQVRDRKSVV